MSMGIMTNQGSTPSLPRLSRPTLPNKMMLVAQVRRANASQDRTERVGKHFKLSPQSQDSAIDDASMKGANLVSEAPSDDERKPSDVVISNSRAMERANSKSDAKDASTQTPTMTSTGVYFQNVEIRKDIHPLQSCRIEDGKSPLRARRVIASRHGRPLTAAPLLPGTAHDASLEPLCFTSLRSKRPKISNTREVSQAKRQRRDDSSEFISSAIVETRQDEPVARKSRSAQVKEASFMIEAAVALTNLQNSLES